MSSLIVELTPAEVVGLKEAPEFAVPRTCEDLEDLNDPDRMQDLADLVQLPEFQALAKRLGIRLDKGTPKIITIRAVAGEQPFVCHRYLPANGVGPAIQETWCPRKN